MIKEHATWWKTYEHLKEKYKIAIETWKTSAKKKTSKIQESKTSETFKEVTNSKSQDDFEEKKKQLTEWKVG